MEFFGLKTSLDLNVRNDVLVNFVYGFRLCLVFFSFAMTKVKNVYTCHYLPPSNKPFKIDSRPLHA